MSTYYRPTHPIKLRDIRDNPDLKELGLKVMQTDQYRVFEMDGHVIHFATDSKNNVIDLFRYGANDPGPILETLTMEFGIRFYDEHDDEYHELANPETSVIKINLEL